LTGIDHIEQGYHSSALSLPLAACTMPEKDGAILCRITPLEYPFSGMNFDPNFDPLENCFYFTLIYTRNQKTLDFHGFFDLHLLTFTLNRIIQLPHQAPQRNA